MSSNIRNPILPGFFPDPSIVRVGEDFYIASSSMEWFPGVPIHHSRDLANWKLIDHALTRSSQLDLRGIGDSAGVWAPSLSFADGQFWLIYTNIRQTGLGRPFKDCGIFLTTAKNILGPWSEPIVLNNIGFDPSLFHDDDGRKWLVNMEWDFRRQGVERFAGIVVQEYDTQKQKLVGTQKKILQKKNVLCEGPNIYKHDGWYYLMLAEGGTSWNHGISLARAKNLFGPYELDPQNALITSRDDASLPLQKAGHGEIVDTQNGEWFLAHLASRPVKNGNQPNAIDKSELAVQHAGEYCVLGRETCLQRLEWRDDWLRLATGGHKPQSEIYAPKNISVQPPEKISLRDDFDSEKLDASWSSLRVPMEENWCSLTARRGWLRLRGRDSLHSLFYQSLVAKRLQHFRATVETCLEFSPEHFAHSAGLICYYDTRTHFYLRVSHHESLGKILGITQTNDGVYSELSDSQIAIQSWNKIFLRAEIDFARLQFSASPDGKSWRNIGPVLDMTRLSDDYGSVFHFTGAMVGLCAQDLKDNSLGADFDYFDYQLK
jgi:xylan 1,4-beta-xylosidase